MKHIIVDNIERCERWNDLPTHCYYYDEKCEGCKQVVIINGKKFCGRTEGKVDLHQIVRGQMGCLFCKYYTKKLNSRVCEDCMINHKDNPPFELIHTKEEYDTWMATKESAGKKLMRKLQEELKQLKEKEK